MKEKQASTTELCNVRVGLKKPRVEERFGILGGEKKTIFANTCACVSLCARVAVVCLSFTNEVSFFLLDAE